MSKFESSLNIKKTDATQLDMNFNDVSKKLDVEKKKEIKDNNSEINDVDNGEEKKPGYDYYGRFNEYKNKKTPASSKKPKTQREKDDDKIRAIKRAIEEEKDKDRKTGYEHSDPWDMSR